MGELLTWSRLAIAIAIYLLTLAFYRLYLHPLAKFPGPKLAALTIYYEGYYDLIQNGQYTFKIAKLHKIYGPIIRISPHELHVSDPDFFNTLYRLDARYDKYRWAVEGAGPNGATLSTASHQIHRARRQPLSPFFSKAKVASQRDMIHRHLQKLCRRLDGYAEARTAFDFGAAVTAFVRDVANEFILGKSYKSLEREDFDAPMLAAGQGLGLMWHVSKFVRFVPLIMQAIPVTWMQKIAGKEMQPLIRYIQETQQDTRNLMEAATVAKDTGIRTIVHEIMDSKLPASDKTFDRIFQDVTTITGAGFETTASVLRLIFFHLFSNADLLRRVRKELASTGSSRGIPLDLQSLEQLPLLTAIIMEGTRLSPGIATRMARVALDTDLFYGEWRIPARTPVGMTLILMHTDEAYWSEPMRFNPDRWIIEGKVQKNVKGYAPFSMGTRGCLGLHLAWAEMYMLTTAMVQSYIFHFQHASAQDFECQSDQYAVSTRGKGVLIATVTNIN